MKIINPHYHPEWGRNREIDNPEPFLTIVRPFDTSWLLNPATSDLEGRNNEPRCQQDETQSHLYLR